MEPRDISESSVKADLKAAFGMLDTNQDGLVNADELKRMMEMLGMKVTSEQVHDVITQASTSGLLSEDEFLRFMSRQTQNEDDIMEDILAAFRVFDKDSNGYITRDELQRAMEIIGETMTETALDELLRAADVDKDGRINYEEFARALL